jgi:hypothetical protein
MSTDWAAENLQVIRTLMERSALYRRALAPLMVVAGVGGLATAGVGRGHEGRFVLLWMTACAAIQCVCLLLVRRQALRAREPFWTSPARRATAAVLPGYCAGGLAGAAYVASSANVPSGTSGALPPVFLLTVFWLFCHACALHAAGVYMPRGIRLFAWVVFAAALGAGVFYWLQPLRATPAAANLLMGAVFGGLHLFFGAYLYLTERRNDET